MAGIGLYVTAAGMDIIPLNPWDLFKSDEDKTDDNNEPRCKNK
jgi:hypothetical protein